MYVYAVGDPVVTSNGNHGKVQGYARNPEGEVLYMVYVNYSDKSTRVEYHTAAKLTAKEAK